MMGSEAQGKEIYRFGEKGIAAAAAGVLECVSTGATIRGGRLGSRKSQPGKCGCRTSSYNGFINMTEGMKNVRGLWLIWMVTDCSGPPRQD